MNDIERAYYAGLFDADGYVRIGISSTKNRQNRNIGHTIYIGICNTNKDILLKAVDLFGGNIFSRKRNKRWRTIHEFRLNAQKARYFLDDVVKYTKIKRARCLLAIDFWKNKGDYPRNRSIPDKPYKFREKCRIEMIGLQENEPLNEEYNKYKSFNKTEEDLVWLAGFIDGDGHIGIQRHKRRNRKAIEYSEHVELANRDRTVLNNIKKIYGGCLLKRKACRSYSLKLERRKAYAVLKDVLQYLEIKQEQAKIVMEFFENKKNFKSKGTPTEEEFRKRDELKKKASAFSYIEQI